MGGQVGAWLLAKPLSSVGSRQHRRRFPGASPAKLAPGSSQSLCLPSGHANTGAVFPARGRPSWRLAPREAFVFCQVTPTPAPFSRRGADQVGAWLLAKPLSSVGSRQHRRLGPGRRGARRRRNKGLQGAAHHVRSVTPRAGPTPPAPAGPTPPPFPRSAAVHVARRALFAVMLFINLQKRYNEMARLARGRFGRRKGTRSKQFITGGIMIGERTCLTKSLV